MKNYSFFEQQSNIDAEQECIIYVPQYSAVDSAFYETLGVNNDCDF